MTDVLNPRETRVLEAIVRNYILNASPTGSRFISRHTDIELSPATIRNVMGDLEDRGFIAQPHTSAGRIPTDRGYRYYVDQLMQSNQLSPEIREQIRTSLLQANPSDLHTVMQATSRALSKTTHQLGIILAPVFRQACFRHIHIYELAPHRFLVNLTIDSGIVRTLAIEIRSEIPAERVESISRIINERFAGKTLDQMYELGDEIFQDVTPYDIGIIRLFIPSIKKMIAETEEQEIYAEGTTNILLQPEFFDKDRISAIVEFLEEKQLLMHMIDVADAGSDGVLVSIGGEIESGQFSSFSVVKTKYRLGNLEGSLGVIGPKRMPYPFLISAVEYTAGLLKEMYE